MNDRLSPILQYTQILQDQRGAGGKDSPAARVFYDQHCDDPEFRVQAGVLHRLMAAKSVPAAAVGA